MGKIKKKASLLVKPGSFEDFLTFEQIFLHFQFESGAATAYIPRNQAIKKLQLTIADFR